MSLEFFFFQSVGSLSAPFLVWQYNYWRLIDFPTVWILPVAYRVQFFMLLCPLYFLKIGSGCRVSMRFRSDPFDKNKSRTLFFWQRRVASAWLFVKLPIVSAQCLSPLIHWGSTIWELLSFFHFFSVLSEILLERGAFPFWSCNGTVYRERQDKCLLLFNLTVFMIMNMLLMFSGGDQLSRF